MMHPCGHDSHIADKFEAVTLPDGRTELVRIPQKIRVRGPHARYCLGCNQFVDEQDDEQAKMEQEDGWEG
jgi:hypothetical protein